MGRLNFKDLKGVIEYAMTSRQAGYEFPLLPRFNKIVGNIVPGQVSVIAGLSSAGVTSFIDQNYVMSVLLQWYNAEEQFKRPLKVFYYTMKDLEIKKLQLLLCNYLKLVDNLRTDVPTLNNQVGRLYDLSKDQPLLTAIDNSKYFFDEVLDNEILDIKSGRVKPTDIYNDILNYIQNDKDPNELVLVIVDSVSYFMSDTDGFTVINGAALDSKFQKIVQELKMDHNISFVLAKEIPYSQFRNVKDSEPHFKQLGTYGYIADKGVILYNSISENNIKYYEDRDLYVTEKGNVLMRTWHVVKNVDGIESVYDRMVFLPGTSYMLEYPYSESITSIGDILTMLEKDSVFKQ